MCRDVPGQGVRPTSSKNGRGDAHDQGKYEGHAWQEDGCVHVAILLFAVVINQVFAHMLFLCLHPAGNQDTTTLVWDIRYPAAPLAVLAGRMGAIRSVLAACTAHLFRGGKSSYSIP